MTEIEKKALALVNEVEAERSMSEWTDICRSKLTMAEALCRAIEQHEAFKREVSDAVEADVAKQIAHGIEPKFRTNSVRFILPKPVDPLVEAVKALQDGRAGPTPESYAACLRNELAARGLEIRESAHDHP